MREPNVAKTIGVVAILFVAMLLLPHLVSKDSVEQALSWTKVLAGILVTVSGVGASAYALTEAKPESRLLGVGPGVVGVLAGSTLLDVGGWAAPVALGLAGVGTAIGFAWVATRSQE